MLLWMHMVSPKLAFVLDSANILLASANSMMMNKLDGDLLFLESIALVGI
jgi:hypothetical protein